MLLRIEQVHTYLSGVAPPEERLLCWRLYMSCTGICMRPHVSSFFIGAEELEMNLRLVSEKQATFALLLDPVPGKTE